MCTRKVAEVTRKGDGRRRWGGWRDRKHVLRRSRFDRLRCSADEAREKLLPLKAVMVVRAVLTDPRGHRNHSTRSDPQELRGAEGPEAASNWLIRFFPRVPARETGKLTQPKE